jgi:hypothetical protein
MRILSDAWNIIREPSNGTSSQVALAIAVIVFGCVVGTVGAFIFGVTARPPGFSNSLAGGLIAALACIAAFSVGGMFGLLFGSPSWGGPVVQRTAGQGDSTTSTESPASSLRPNTSLERIADWLTTMIVGLSLVHLKTIEDRSTALGLWLTKAITGVESPNGTPGIVIVLPYTFAGFLLVYLWSMRFLPSELRNSYSDLSHRIDSIEGKFNNFKISPIFGVPEHALDRVRQRLLQDGVTELIVDDVVKRYRSASKASDEPMKEFGPLAQDGYELAGRIEQVDPSHFRIQVTLTAPSGSKATNVHWLQHNTYAPDVVTECPVVRGLSTYQTTANEAFWLGAIVIRPGEDPLCLAIDLRTANGATDTFRGSASS